MARMGMEPAFYRSSHSPGTARPAFQTVLLTQRIAMAFFAPRDVKTTLVCPTCGAPLHIARTCHEVYMHCPACKAQFPLQDYIRQADEAMEHFLENVYCNRI